MWTPRKQNVRKAADSTPGTDCKYLTPAHLKERRAASSEKKELLTPAQQETHDHLWLAGWIMPSLTKEAVLQLLNFISCIKSQVVDVARLVSRPDKGDHMVILRLNGGSDMKYQRSIATFQGAKSAVDFLVCDQEYLADENRVKFVLDLDLGAGCSDVDQMSMLIYQMATIVTYESGDTTAMYNQILVAEERRVRQERASLESKMSEACADLHEWSNHYQFARKCNVAVGMPTRVCSDMYELTMVTVAEHRCRELDERLMYSKTICELAAVSS